MEQEGKDGKNKNSDSPFDSDASCKEVFPLGDLRKVVVAPFAPIDIVPPKIGDMDQRPATSGSAGRGGGVCHILGRF